MGIVSGFVLPAAGLLVVLLWMFHVPGLPDLLEGEAVIRKAKASLSINNLIGSGAGNLYLTNKRLVWRRPLLSFLRGPAPQHQSIALRDISYVVHSQANIGKGIPLLNAFGSANQQLTIEVSAKGHRLFLTPSAFNPFRILRSPAGWIDAINTARRDEAAQQTGSVETNLIPPTEADIRRHGLLSVAMVMAPLALCATIFALLDSEASILLAAVALFNLPVAWFRWKAYKEGRP